MFMVGAAMCVRVSHRWRCRLLNIGIRLGVRHVLRRCVAKVEPAVLAALGMWCGLGLGTGSSGPEGAGLGVLGFALVLGALGITISELVPARGRSELERRSARGRICTVPAAFCTGLVIAGAVVRYQAQVTAIPQTLAWRRDGCLQTLSLSTMEGVLSVDSQTTARQYRRLQIEVQSLVYRKGAISVVCEPRCEAQRRRLFFSVLAQPGPRLWAGTPCRAEGLRTGSIVFSERIEVLDDVFRDWEIGRVQSWFSRIRAKLAGAFAQALSNAAGCAGPLAQALLLGVKDEIDSEFRDLFRAAGCSYLLALSGQHLSIICALAALAGRRLFRREKAVRRLSLLCAWAFVWLAGPGPSLMRAVFMLSIAETARSLDRPQTGLSALALSSLALALLAPLDITSLSSIFSFAAMAGLILFSPRLSHLFRGWFPPFLAEPLSASCSALFATVPVSIINFGMFTFASIVTATASGIVMLAFMWTALFAGLVVAVLPQIARFSAPLLELLERMLLAILEAGARIPAIQAETTASRLLWLAIIAALCALRYAVIALFRTSAVSQKRAELEKAGQVIRARNALLRSWIEA